ncbi:S8 family serine peptidase [Actinoplanes solisilvae]|uniref:S8 family serine peptidase n=1 Tax=Actinoplanes solisilvae TaxID=2486853 RepID=UPI00196AC75B|nr:S8 family serine peptidase [Actinoplanes solisilvae]
MLVQSVLAVVTAAAVGAIPAAPASADPPAAPGETRTVTLITGDRVTLSGDTVIRVEAPGGLRVSTFEGDTYAYPDAAMPYVASGLLDEELFNVTRLVADGYDDARAARLPLIVEYADGIRALPKSASAVRPLESIGGAAITVARTREFFSTLARPGTSMPSLPKLSAIKRVWLDGKVRATLADSTAQIGAPKVWAGGDTGAGVDVAVLDTGVDTGHPDLAGRIEEATSFVPGEEVTDRHGHGTHVASTIAGTGAASGGAEKGVAPGAELHIGKVLNDQGEGQDSWIIGGMEWAARTAKAKVINMSLGGGPTDGTDPLSAAVDRLSAETGALFVIAAGNSGPDAETVGAPGAATSALTVGAVNQYDLLATFSSRGGRWGDNAPKPDLSAPGVDILAARSQYAPKGEGAYQTMSGTSMATPHVAGAAALLAAAHPDWTGPRLKNVLMSTSVQVPRVPPEWAGTGRIDVDKAVHGTVFATGSTFASLRWPYAPGQQAEQVITYTNLGDTAVTLDLNVTSSAFTLPQEQITVPARGTTDAKVVLPLDPMPDDTYAMAYLVASGPDGVALRSTVAVNREGKRALVKVNTKGPDGKPLEGTLILKDVLNDTAPKAYRIEASGTAELRLPTSTWAAWLYSDVRGAGGPHSLGQAVVVAPEVVVEGDRSLTLDGTKLTQARVTTPQRSTMAELRVDLFRSYPSRHPFGDALFLGPQYDSIWLTPTAKVKQGSFTVGTRWSSMQAPLTLTVGGERFDDLLYQSGSGRLPEGTGKRGAVLVPPGASFTAARGKVAVVRFVDVNTALAQAAAAAKAGATMLLIVNSGAGRLDAWWDVSDPATPLPVAGIARDPGERLIARLGRSSVTVESHPVPRFVYDLNRWHRDAIPSNLSWRPRERDLARVEQEFRALKPGSGYMVRGDVPPDRPGSMYFGPSLPIPAQGKRTDWVSPGSWREQAGVSGELTMISDAQAYPTGRTSKATWFAPVGRPRQFAAGMFPAPARNGYIVGVFALPGFADSDPHHQGTLSRGVTQTTALYEGSVELARADEDKLEAWVGEEAKSLRLVTEVTNDGSYTPYSTRTRTEWAFHSPKPNLDPVESVPLELTQLDYRVATDLSGVASRKAHLAVTASRMNGKPLGAARVEVSYDDGRSWRALPKSGVLDAPRSARFVSVRATAADPARQGSVTQTVIRAFGVR